MSKTSPMQEAIRDAIGPDAVALAAKYLLTAKCDDEQINREVRWFAEQLVDMLGGKKGFRQTCKGMGI